MTPRKAIAYLLVLAAVITITWGLIVDPEATRQTLLGVAIVLSASEILTYLILAAAENKWKFWENT